MTDLRSSQDTVEAWVQNPAALRVSQVGAEVWYRHIPITAVVVSQALAELWLPSPAAAPLYRRRPPSAQVV